MTRVLDIIRELYCCTMSPCVWHVANLSDANNDMVILTLVFLEPWVIQYSPL